MILNAVSQGHANFTISPAPIVLSVLMVHRISVGKGKDLR